jgi:hypothetical protein
MATREQRAPLWSPRTPFCGECGRTIWEEHEDDCSQDDMGTEPPPTPPLVSDLSPLHVVLE